MDVLILSRNVAIYSTRRLTEAFRARGRQVTVLDPAALTLGLDSTNATLATRGQVLEAPRVAVPRIGTLGVSHALAVLRHLELQGVPLVAPSRAVAAAKDKFCCLQALAAAGLPVPQTALAREGGDADPAIAAVGGPPVVLKLLTGTHGVGVILCESADAARATLQALWDLDRDVLVQRYVAESAGQDLRLFVVGDRVVGGIRRTGPEGSFRSNLHGGGTAEAYSPSPELTDLALRAAGALGLRVAGVDLMLSADGPLVTEVNSSPGLEGIEDATGSDVAGAVADEALRLIP